MKASLFCRTAHRLFQTYFQIGGHEITWVQIRTMFEEDLGGGRIAPGLRKTKLTVDHIELTPRSRMKVNLAVQV